MRYAVILFDWRYGTLAAFALEMTRVPNSTGNVNVATKTKINIYFFLKIQYSVPYIVENTVQLFVDNILLPDYRF